MSLVEVLVAIGVLSTVIFASTQYFGSVNRGKQKDRLRDMQKTLASVVKNAIKSPSNIFYSVSRYDVNPSLASCVLNIKVDASTGKCDDATDRSNPVRFAVFSITSQDGMQALQLSTGQTATGIIYYDINGKVCKKANDRKCFFEVETKFYATCAGDGTTDCPRGASQVFFTYEVRQKVGVFDDFFGIWRLPPYPKKTTYISMTPGQILGPDRNSECGSDAFNQGASDMAATTFEKVFSNKEGFFGTLTGYDQYGRPKCECLYPFEWVADEEDGDTGITYPVCKLIPAERLSCEKGAYLRGVQSTKDNKSVICKNILEAFDCTQTYSDRDNCGDGYFLMKFVRSPCLFRCQYTPDKVRTCNFVWTTSGGSQQLTPKSESGGTEVRFSCDTKEIKCCRPKMYNK